MRYSQIRELDISNGEGVGISLFVQGCPFHCKNCFNKETWDFSGGKDFNKEVRDKFLNLIDRPYITRVSILGGEPLCVENYLDVHFLVKRIRRRFGTQKKIWVYSGHVYEDFVNPEVLAMFDVLVDGQYIDEQRDLTLAFRGSKNQRLIDCPRSVLRGEAVLYDPYNLFEYSDRYIAGHWDLEDKACLD